MHSSKNVLSSDDVLGMSCYSDYEMIALGSFTHWNELYFSFFFLVESYLLLLFKLTFTLS
jgi:hypothetical protein